MSMNRWDREALEDRLGAIHLNMDEATSLEDLKRETINLLEIVQSLMKIVLREEDDTVREPWNDHR